MPERFRVPRQVLRETSSFLRARGQEHREGIVLWKTRAPRGAEIIDVVGIVIPEQEAPTMQEGCYVLVPLQYRTRLTRELDASGERIVAQVHSHPGRAFHSEVDNELPVIHHRGALSLVVPNFCRLALEDFSRVAVFRMREWPDWDELTANEVVETLEVVP